MTRREGEQAQHEVIWTEATPLFDSEDEEEEEQEEEEASRIDETASTSAGVQRLSIHWIFLAGTK